MTKPLPTPTAERIQTIDVLRGFALLGILFMNIQAMSMIQAAYSNPTAFGDLNGLNYHVWWIGHVFFDQKMMTLFSLLFGAGIALMTDRAFNKTGKSAGLHYYRMLWLMVIGMTHAYCIWFGDILVSYSICGMVFYWFRRWSPWILFCLGLAALSVPPLINVALNQLFSLLPEPDLASATAEFAATWNPPLAEVQKEISAYQGTWVEQMQYRVKTAVFFQTMLFGLWSFWRVGGLMLIGMALFRWGVFSAARSNGTYVAMAVIGLGAGLPTVLMGIDQFWQHEWDVMYCMFAGTHYNYFGGLLVAMGYIGCVMLLVKNRLLPKFLMAALGSVGQMALTNYLLHSVLGTLIFYGHGFGLFGEVSRSYQALIVVSIWVFQLWFSSWWLSRFQFGPMEWLWRSLTYWQPQPFKAAVANN